MFYLPKKKAPIDLNIMDYIQMFDSEEALICLNALYYEEVMDYILALTCQTKKVQLLPLRLQI